MRALRIPAYGGPEVLVIVDVPDPIPAAGEVLVRVEAAPMQIADVALREGHLADVMPASRLPMSVGWECAGVVVATGAGSSRFPVGTAVVGMSRHFFTQVGTQAELVALPEENLAAAPTTVDAVTASALPLALTAVQALDLLQVGPDTTVLVTGGVGAVGGYAVQLARLRGATVVASVSHADADLARGLGATHVLDRHGDVDAQVRALLPGGVDALFNTVPVNEGAFAAVRDGGRAVVTLLPAPEPGRGIATEVVFVEPHAQRLAELVRLVESGQLTLRVSRTYPLHQAAQAHRELARGGLRGRLVLLP